MRALKSFALLATLASVVLLGGCASQTTETYRQDFGRTLLRVTNQGFKFLDDPVTPAEAIKRLEKAGVPKTAEIRVQADDDFTDMQVWWVFQHNYLNRAGYRRSVLVSPVRAQSGTAHELRPKLESRKIDYEGQNRIKGGAVTPPRRTW